MTGHIEQIFTCEVVDQDGSRIGAVGQVYLDDVTGEPTWVTVKTGLFGLKETFAPLHASTLADGQLRLPYPAQVVKDAPRVDPDKHLDAAEEADLYRYYQIIPVVADDGQTDYRSLIVDTEPNYQVEKVSPEAGEPPVQVIGAPAAPGLPVEREAPAESAFPAEPAISLASAVDQSLDLPYGAADQITDPTPATAQADQASIPPDLPPVEADEQASGEDEPRIALALAIEPEEPGEPALPTEASGSAQVTAGDPYNDIDPD